MNTQMTFTPEEGRVVLRALRRRESQMHVLIEQLKASCERLDLPYPAEDVEKAVGLVGALTFRFNQQFGEPEPAPIHFEEPPQL